MRILVWHGWFLGGSGSSVYTARIVEVWRSRGHDVLLLCQEAHPERQGYLDAWGKAPDDAALRPLHAEPASGRAVLVRPDIGDLLPAFVYDEYEGFRVKTFVDLTDDELETYLEANVTALRAAVEWHGSQVVVAGHALPAPAVARRAVGSLPCVVKIHGSDIEYAVRVQPRYLELAREGLEGAEAVAGASRDVLDRLVELVPSVADRVRVVVPGVEGRFRPMPREEALVGAADLLEAEPARARGRTGEVARRVTEALHRRDAAALDRLAGTYDQTAPDAVSPARLRSLAGGEDPLVGYLGKLIPQKGVDHLIASLAILDPRIRALIVGFGTFREWLEALIAALDAADREAVAFLHDRSPMRVDLTAEQVAAAAGLAGRVTFTGRLDHRYAAMVVAALDVLVVPSILEEALGMVALEGAAAGTLPLVARHSGLAEVAAALEEEIGEPGLLSYAPGKAAIQNLAGALERLLAVPRAERRELARRLSAFVAGTWSWERTAHELLGAAAMGRHG